MKEDESTLVHSLHLDEDSMTQLTRLFKVSGAVTNMMIMHATMQLTGS